MYLKIIFSECIIFLVRNIKLWVFKKRILNQNERYVRKLETSNWAK